MKRTQSIALAAACIAGIAGAIVADAAPLSPTAIVSMRHANFKKMGAAMKVLKDELGGSADKAKMLAAAKVIAATGRQQGNLFPASTAPGKVRTHALPAIWTDRATFDGDMKKMVMEADKLVAVAGSGNTALVGDQLKAVGATCGACHRQFRKED